MKRKFEISIILLFCPIILIIIALTAIFIKLNLGSPIFFVQERSGLDGELFNFVKFRTMTNKKDKNGLLASDKDRLTTFGKWLRKTSLDEFPTFWNVIKGDMSLVGPRPLLKEYLHLYSNFQMRRHDVKPGITGWAQINGRNKLSWEDKFDLDVWYVDNNTFWLDLKIIFITIKKVIIRDGITEEKNVTMTKFKGTKNKNF